MKVYRVGSFWNPELGKRGRATAYTMWFDEQWSGCIIHEIEAESGAEAKKIAIKLRTEMELGKP